MYIHVFAYRNSPGSMLQCTLFSTGTPLPLNADALAPLVFEHWHLTAMSSREDNPAKRHRFDNSLLRPGIGLWSNEEKEEEEEDLLPFGLGARAVNN